MRYNELGTLHYQIMKIKETFNIPLILVGDNSNFKKWNNLKEGEQFSEEAERITDEDVKVLTDKENFSCGYMKCNIRNGMVI
jgi:hypothetical protein